MIHIDSWSKYQSSGIIVRQNCSPLLLNARCCSSQIKKDLTGAKKKQKSKGQTPPPCSWSECIWDHGHWGMPARASTNLFFPCCTIPCCTIEPRPPATLDEEKTPPRKSGLGWVVSIGVVYNWKESGLQNQELSGSNPTWLVEFHSDHSGLYSSTWYNAWAMNVAGRWVQRK